MVRSTASYSPVVAQHALIERAPGGPAPNVPGRTSGDYAIEHNGAIRFAINSTAIIRAEPVRQSKTGQDCSVGEISAANITKSIDDRNVRSVDAAQRKWFGEGGSASQKLRGPCR